MVESLRVLQVARPTTTEGQSKLEILRCLKRYLAREEFYLIKNDFSRPAHPGDLTTGGHPGQRIHRGRVPGGLRPAGHRPVNGGRPGPALDNAVIDDAGVQLRSCETSPLVCCARVAAWIDDYNRRRRHSALGMMSPVNYEHTMATGETAQIICFSRHPASWTATALRQLHGS